MCNFYTSPEWLGNPCIGVAKFLTVEYDCRLRGISRVAVTKLETFLLTEILNYSEVHV